MHVRTEPLGGSTLAAAIRCDDPCQRPSRPVDVRFRRSATNGAAAPVETPRFRLTFLEGSVWDVARIASRLEVRSAHDPERASWATRAARSGGSVALHESAGIAEADESTRVTWAVLSIDDSGRTRRDAFELVTR